MIQSEARSPGGLARLAVSGVIVVVLALQTLAALRIGVGPFAVPPPYTYPFLNYPMYQNPHYADSVVEIERIVATLSDGVERPVEAADLDMPFWIFRRQLLAAVSARDSVRLALFADLLERRRDVRAVSFRIDAQPVYLEEAGVRYGAERRGDPVPVAAR